jgi:hypothetical protein
VLIVALAILPFVLFRSPALSSSIARSFWMSMLVFAFINFILYPAMLRYQAGTRAGRYLETHPELMAASTPTTSAAGTPASTAATTGNPAAASGAEPPVAYLLLEAPASFSFEFDAPGSVARVPVDSLPHPLPSGGILVFAPTNFADTLTGKGYQATPLQHFDYFHISQLTGEFLNYRTRASVLKPWELYRVTR